MNRRFLLLIVLSWMPCSFGCGASSQTQPKREGDLSKAEIESRLKDDLKLKEISLTEGTKGKFTGMGTGTDGTKHTITVTQSQNELHWESKDEKGGTVTGTLQTVVR